MNDKVHPRVVSNHGAAISKCPSVGKRFSKAAGVGCPWWAAIILSPPPATAAGCPGRASAHFLSVVWLPERPVDCCCLLLHFFDTMSPDAGSNLLGIKVCAAQKRWDLAPRSQPTATGGQEPVGMRLHLIPGGRSERHPVHWSERAVGHTSVLAAGPVPPLCYSSWPCPPAPHGE